MDRSCYCLSEMHHGGQYTRVHAWRPKELNPRAKANGFLGSRPVISNAPGPEVITAADCADRKVRHSKGTPHAERGACVNRALKTMLDTERCAWVCRCSRRPELHGCALKSLWRQRSLGVAVIFDSRAHTSTFCSKMPVGEV